MIWRLRVAASIPAWLALFAAVPMAAAQPVANDPVGAITRIQGKGGVVVCMPDGATRKATPAMALRLGEKIVAGKGTKVTVVYVDRAPTILNATLAQQELPIAAAPAIGAAGKLRRALDLLKALFGSKQYLVDPAVGDRSRQTPNPQGPVLRTVIRLNYNLSLDLGDPEQLARFLAAPVASPTDSAASPDLRLLCWSPLCVRFPMAVNDIAWQVTLTDDRRQLLWRSDMLGGVEAPLPDAIVLEPGKSYRWYVEANANGWTMLSREWRFTVASEEAVHAAADDLAAVDEALATGDDDVSHRALRATILLEHGFADHAEGETRIGLKDDPENALLLRLLKEAMRWPEVQEDEEARE